MAQLEERAILYLTHALARHTEYFSDYLERHRLVAFEAELHAQHARFTRLEDEQRLVDSLDECLLESFFIRQKAICIGKVIYERVVFARRHWRVEREVRVRDRHGARDLFLGDTHPLGDFMMRRLAPQVLEQHCRVLSDT